MIKISMDILEYGTTVSHPKPLPSLPLPHPPGASLNIDRKSVQVTFIYNYTRWRTGDTSI